MSLKIGVTKISHASHLTTLILILLYGCKSPTPTNIFEDEDGSSTYSTITISELKAKYLGSTHQIVDDIFIDATVVATDMFGELEGRMVLQDDSGGIEVYIDEERLYESYQLYSVITLNCSGLWLASRGGSNGTLVMGSYPTSYDPVDGISSTQFDARVIEYQIGKNTYDYNYYHLSDLSTSLISSCVVMQSLSFTDVDSNETLFDYDQYDELGYCRRTMECQQSGLTIDLYIPDTIVYPNLSISQIEDANGNYLVLIDRYASNYSIQLVGMGGF